MGGAKISMHVKKKQRIIKVLNLIALFNPLLPCILFKETFGQHFDFNLRREIHQKNPMRIATMSR